MMVTRTFRKTVLTIALAISCLTLSAQTVRPLKINDTLPDIAVQNLIRTDTKAIRTSELYRNGLLIINFWASWCQPCGTELAFLAQQVRQSKGKINVLCIGYESEAIVLDYLRRHPDLANSGLEFVFADKYWVKAFFHQALPHNVWINSKGIVKSITGGDQITAKNLSDFLGQTLVTMYQKEETPFDMFKPMKVPDSLLEYRSMFNRTLPGVTLSGSASDSGGWGFPNMKRFFVFNMLERYIFFKAYAMPGMLDSQTAAYLIEVHTSDSARYFWPGLAKDPSKYQGISHSDWDRSHVYSYELRLPHAIEDSLFSRKVVSELEYNFNVKTSRENRPRICMVVSLAEDHGLIRRSNPQDTPYVNIVGNKLILRNAPIARLLDFINKFTYTKASHSRKEPYVDETGLNGRFDLEVDVGDDPAKYHSQAFLEECLSKQTGLKFKLRNQLFPILVIRDTKKGDE